MRDGGVDYVFKKSTAVAEAFERLVNGDDGLF